MGIATLATYLVEGQAVPYARASQFLQELLGVQLSPGSIAAFVKTCHQHLAPIEEQLKAALVKSQVIHQDETGMRVGKEGWWVHVCSTKRLTHYGVHRCRGREGLEAIGIAPAFRGTSVHDGLGSYQSYSFTQALCNVHHLRELTFIEEECKQPWAKQMKEEVEQAWGFCITPRNGALGFATMTISSHPDWVNVSHLLPDGRLTSFSASSICQTNCMNGRTKVVLRAISSGAARGRVRLLQRRLKRVSLPPAWYRWS